MPQDLVSLAKIVHEIYAPSCDCKPHGEYGRYGVFKKCARKTLLHKAEMLMNQLSKLGYSNKEIAKNANSHASITSRAHSGGAELQLGLSKLLNLVRSLEHAFEDACTQHFNLSIRSQENIVQPLDNCSRNAATDELMREAAAATYFNVCSILLARPAEERRSLPEGFEGLISSLGDPAYGITVIQVEPTDELERLKRQLHEIKHYEERLEDRIRQLVVEKNQQKKRKTPRARFC